MLFYKCSARLISSFCARYFLISYCYLKCNSTLSLPSQPSRRVGPVIGVVETRPGGPGWVCTGVHTPTPMYSTVYLLCVYRVVYNLL